MPVHLQPRRRDVLARIPLALAGFGFAGHATGATSVPGDPDPSFAGTGRYVSPWGGISAFGPGVAMLADGSLVVGGKNRTSTLDQFAAFRLGSNGVLDTSFGASGLVQQSFGTTARPATNDENIKVVTVQFDGKLLVAGEGNSGSYGQHGVMRLNANGSLDTSFGGTGRVIVDFGRPSHAHDIKQQADGKLLVMGDYYSGTLGTLSLVRLRLDGSIDTGFANGGKLLGNLGAHTNGHCVTPLADGRILCAGYVDTTTTGLNSAFFVARLTSSGALDASFGGGGRTLVQAGANASNNYCHWMVVQPDGKILVFGGSVVNRVGDIAMMRFTSEGALDTSFGNGGVVVTDFTGAAAASGEEAATGALQADGKILLAGYSEGRFVVARYTAAGTLDGSFGVSGKVFVSLGTGGDDFAKSMLLQPDGRIVVAGYSKSGGRFTMAVVRLLNDVAGSPLPSSDNERLFRWAEFRFAALFPAGPQTQLAMGYTLRYYAATGNYLGTRDGSVFVYGAPFGGLLNVGTVADLLAQASREGF